MHRKIDFCRGLSGFAMTALLVSGLFIHSSSARAEKLADGEDENRQGDGQGGWGGPSVSWDSFCTASGGTAAVEASGAGGEVERRAGGDGVWLALHAADDL